MPRTVDGAGDQEPDAQPGGESRSNRASRFVSVLCVCFVLLVVLPPFAAIANQSFLVHQLQTLTLRAVIPLLLVLWVLQIPSLLASLTQSPSSRARGRVQRLITTVVGNFSPLAVAFILFVTSLYVWKIPAIHDAIVSNGVVHQIQHVSLIMTGLLFFGYVFDQRPPPVSSGYGQRVVALIGAIFANIPIGSALVLKGTIWYTAYGDSERWRLSPQDDEILGGIVIWIVSSLLGLIAVLFLLRQWTAFESNQGNSQCRAAISPASTVNQVASASNSGPTARRAHLKFGIGLGCLSVVMFTVAMFLGYWVTRQS